jgi:hypothetical protein
MAQSVHFQGYRPGEQKMVVLFLVGAPDFFVLPMRLGRLWDPSGPFNGNRG